MHEQIGNNNILYHNTAKAYGSSILSTKILTGHIITTHCFQSLIGIATLLSVISYYRFRILKD